MHFSVECTFPHLGKRGAASRKSTLCNLHLTEKHTLPPAPHGKAHSATCASRKSTFCNLRLTEKRTLRSPDRAECAFPSRCGAREVWGNPPARLRGTMENASTGQTRSSNPPPACGAACARVRRSRFGFDLTEKRTLPNRWVQNALFRHDVTAECAFPSRRNRRMRLSVRVPAQNALFRRVRLFSPGQTWRRLTEKRTLPPAPHGKAHSAGARTGLGQDQDRAKEVEIFESG